MIAIERYVKAKIYLNDIFYEKIKLTSLDNCSQFLKLDLSNLSKISDYKMLVYFILPFPLQNIIAEEVNELTQEVIITIPKTALIITGELKIEIAFYNKVTYQYLTIPKRIQLEIAETVNNENPDSVIPGESILTSITDLIDKIDNICEEKISEVESELSIILTRLRNELSEYKSSLELELQNTNDDLLKNSLANLNSFLFHSKEDLLIFFNSNKEKISENLINSINEINSLVENKINEINIFVEKITSYFNSQKEEITNFIETTKNDSKDFIDKVLNDALLKIGTADDSMYDKYYPSARKDAIDSIKNQKFEILEETRKEIKKRIDEHISRLKEQYFTIELVPYTNEINLPIDFIVNGLTKVYSNGHLLTYRKDYFFDVNSRHIIRLNYTSPSYQTIVVTETLATDKSLDFSETSSENYPNTIVLRNELGNFSVNCINGNLNGNASTATKLEKAVNINGIPFDGSKDITIEQLDYNIASEEEIIAIFTNKII